MAAPGTGAVPVAVAGQGLHHRVEPGRGSHGHRGPPDGGAPRGVAVPSDDAEAERRRGGAAAADVDAERPARRGGAAAADGAGAGVRRKDAYAWLKGWEVVLLQ